MLGHLRNASDGDPVVIFVKGLLVKADLVKAKESANILRKSQEENIAEFEAQFYAKINAGSCNAPCKLLNYRGWRVRK